MTTETLEDVKVPRLDVQVTHAEIERAVPQNSGHCMIADAVKRCYPNKTKRKGSAVSVDLQTIRVTDKEMGVRIIYLTPSVAQRALLQFDQGIKPTPFNFRLSGGQIVPLRSKIREQNKKPRTEKQKKATKKAQKKAHAASRAKAKAKVKTTSQRSPEVTKVGGKAPPVAVLTGNRRQFGIKACGDLNGPTQ